MITRLAATLAPVSYSAPSRDGGFVQTRRVDLMSAFCWDNCQLDRGSFRRESESCARSIRGCQVRVRFQRAAPSGRLDGSPGYAPVRGMHDWHCRIATGPFIRQERDTGQLAPPGLSPTASTLQQQSTGQSTVAYAEKELLTRYIM